MRFEGDLTVKAGVDYSKITEIGGSLYCRGADTSFPKLTSIGGYLDCGGADTKASFPKLTSIGGYLDCGGADTNFNKHLKTNDPSAAAICRKLLFASFMASGFVFCDGILAKRVSQRCSRSINVYVVVIVGQSEKSVIIETNGVYSHGKTIKEAKESLIFKITDRDTARFKAWKLNTKITAADAIAAYRAITGACEFGVKHFCDGKDLKRTYTLHEIIKMTAGAYGNDTFKNFFARA